MTQNIAESQQVSTLFWRLSNFPLISLEHILTEFENRFAHKAYKVTIINYIQEGFLSKKSKMQHYYYKLRKASSELYLYSVMINNNLELFKIEMSKNKLQRRILFHRHYSFKDKNINRELDKKSLFLWKIYY